MKKIISNRRYDTDTATLVAEAEFGYPGDFAYYQERLYRKRSHEYFIHGEGNAASRYAKAVPGGNSWRSGEGIVPLSYEQAREWGEQNMSTEEYEAEFGEVLPEEDGTVVLSVRVSTAAKAKLDRHCRTTGRQTREVVDELLSSLG